MKTTPSQQLFDSNSETSKTSRCPLHLKSCATISVYSTKKIMIHKKKKKKRVSLHLLLWKVVLWVRHVVQWRVSAVSVVPERRCCLRSSTNAPPKHAHTQAAQQQQSLRGKRTFLPVRLELIKTSGHIYTSEGAFLWLEEGRGILEAFSIFKVNLRTSWM